MKNDFEEVLIEDKELARKKYEEIYGYRLAVKRYCKNTRTGGNYFVW